MGPRHCCRGILLESSRAERYAGRFNGAAALLPRNLTQRKQLTRLALGFNGAAALLPRNLLHLLPEHRWRPRFNGAAALLPRNPASSEQTELRAWLASMGPRHCCRGIPGEPLLDSSG